MSLKDWEKKVYSKDAIEFSSNKYGVISIGWEYKGKKGKVWIVDYNVKGFAEFSEFFDTKAQALKSVKKYIEEKN